MVPSAKSTHSSVALLARRLADQRISSEAELLRIAVVGVLDQVVDAECSGITLADKEALRTAAATSRVPTLLDELQTAAGDGPTLHAVVEWNSHVVRVDDYATEKRWPAYVEQATRCTSVRSSLSFQLYRAEEAMGVLNVYSAKAHAFSAEAQDVGLAIATHTALALHFARRDVQFTTALASRDVIGQAKGMIMERFRVDVQQAWQLLRALSQNENTPVHTVARQLIAAEKFHSATR